MYFTEEDIAGMCSARSTFLAGKRYYESGRIKKIEKSRVNSAETYLYARVKGTHLYNVTVWVEDGQIAHKICDCPAFHKYSGICKHIAAVLLSFADKTSTPAPDRVTTAPVMNMIIKTYTNHENAAALSMENTEKMTVVPHITIDGKRNIVADFKVGSRRKYVIRDICKFVQSVENCEYFSYGKNFGFLHTVNAFDERSKRLVDFIKSAVSENEIFNSAYNKYAYLVPLSTRELTLTPAAVDTLIDIYMGGMSGVETAKRIRALDKNVMLVFVTTSNEFASESYAVKANFYLLKPVRAESVRQLAETVAQQLKNTGSAAALPDGTVIPLASLVYTSCSGHYVNVFLVGNEPLKIRTTHKIMEESLSKYEGVISCNKGVLVSLANVARIDGENFLMINGDTVPISRRKMTQIKNDYTRFVLNRIHSEFERDQVTVR